MEDEKNSRDQASNAIPKSLNNQNQLRITVKKKQLNNAKVEDLASVFGVCSTYADRIHTARHSLKDFIY